MRRIAARASRYAPWLLASLGGLAGALSALLAGASLPVTLLVGLAFLSVGGAIALAIVKSSRASRLILRQLRNADEGQTKQTSRVLYHARRGADAASSAARSVRSPAADRRVLQQLDEISASATASARRLEQQIDAVARRAVATTEQRSIPAPTRAAPRPPSIAGLSPAEWAFEREFDLRSAAPVATDRRALCVRADVSDRYAASLAAAVRVVRNAESRDVLADIVLVSDAGVAAELGAANDGTTIADAMIARLRALSAFAGADATWVALIESATLTPRELEALAGQCDVLVRPVVPVIGAALNHVPAGGILSLEPLFAQPPAALDDEAADPVSEFRALHAGRGHAVEVIAAAFDLSREETPPVPEDLLELLEGQALWTPRRLVDRIQSIAKRTASLTDTATLVVKVESDDEVQQLRSSLAAHASPRVARIVVVLGRAIPDHLVIKHTAALASARVIVVPTASLGDRAIRTDLVETAYAICTPPTSLPTASEVSMLLALAEGAKMPLALADHRVGPTLIDPSRSVFVASPETALAAVQRDDRLMPAYTMRTDRS